MSPEDAKQGWWQRACTQVVGIDARSLAAFRWTIAVLLLIDLAVRWPTLVDFQTDQGLWTRDLDRQYIHQHLDEWDGNPIPEQPLPYWSLHLINGELWFQQVLFGVQALAVVLMGIGYRTRLMTFISWLLLISMHVRNPIVLNSGDTLLRMLLFWSLFLPLGARWSVDRAFRNCPASATTITSVASAAIILQLCFMYWFTGISKYNEIWFSGEAIENVLKLDLLARPSSKFLLAYPDVLRVLSWATVWGELILPCMLFIPWKTSWWRVLNIVAFGLFHIGILCVISVGLFSAISMAAWLLLLPAEFWNSRVVQSVIGSLFGSNTIVEEDRDLTVEEPPVGWRRWGNIALQSVVGLLVLFVFAWNLSRIDLKNPRFTQFMPRQLYPIGATLMVAQEFKMFDTPGHKEFWFVYDAQLKNGNQVDLFAEKPTTGTNKPDDIHQRYRDHRWRRMHANLVYGEYQMLHRPLLEYFVRRWNENHAHEHQVTSAKLVIFERVTAREGGEGNTAAITLVQIGEDDPLQRLLDAVDRSGSILP